jgi:hypothetical protein
VKAEMNHLSFLLYGIVAKLHEDCQHPSQTQPLLTPETLQIPDPQWSQCPPWDEWKFYAKQADCIPIMLTTIVLKRGKMIFKVFSISKLLNRYKASNKYKVLQQINL